MLFLQKDENDNNSIDIPKFLVSASVAALMNGMQEGISVMLTTSTMQAMTAYKVHQLMDETKFLIHGYNKNITSIQYITVGVRIRDFVTNTVPNIYCSTYCTQYYLLVLLYILE